jgi:hypothetical protein
LDDIGAAIDTVRAVFRMFLVWDAAIDLYGVAGRAAVPVPGGFDPDSGDDVVWTILGTDFGRMATAVRWFRGGCGRLAAGYSVFRAASAWGDGRA